VSEPQVSVVIPTRDRAEQLLRCLQAIAVAARPVGGVEVVVVNDGGEALNGEAVAAVGNGLAIRFLDQPGRGPAAARNRGAAAAAGPVLAFTDDDCEPAPGWLEALGKRLDRNPEVVVAGRAASLHPDNDWATAGQILTDHLHRWYNRDPEHGSFMTSNNLALRAETFRSLGGFDASFPSAAAEDREFAERALRAGHRLVYEPAAVVGHRHRLTARAFLRQHYGYGRGARRVLRARRRAGGGMVFEPPGFYTQMLRSPWHEHAGARAARLTLLLAASQAAHTAGFVREGLRA
jgi:GT2 family glycosyltransferase